MSDGAPNPNPAAARRVFRVLKIAFVAYTALLFFVVIRIPPKSRIPVDGTIQAAITAVALAALVLGFVVPRFLVKPANSSIANATAPSPIKRWFTAGVVGLAFLEACSLFGVTLHFLGAGLERSELLIGAGLVATVFFSPGTLPGAGPSGNLRD
jgi:hypothetical protein